MSVRCIPDPNHSIFHEAQTRSSACPSRLGGEGGTWCGGPGEPEPREFPCGEVLRQGKVLL